MGESGCSPGICKFGIFEVDLRAGELRRQGLRIKLQDQPFRVLVALLEHPGEVVTREELRERLWPDGTVVEFDHSLASAVNRLREALGDSSDSPRYIETLSRRGYRFIGHVDGFAVAGVADIETASETEPPKRMTGRPRKLRHLKVTAAVLIVALAVVTAWRLLRTPAESERVLTAVPFTSYPGSETRPTFSPDGNQVAFQWNGEKEDNWDIYVKTVGSEKPLRLTTDPGIDSDPSWSPDGSRIAFVRTGEKGFTVYTIPPLGGVEGKVHETPYVAKVELLGRKLTWTPDSRGIVISEREADSDPNALFLVLLASGEKRRLTTPPSGFNGDADPAFSPDSRILSFSRMRDLNFADLYLLHLTPELKPAGEPEALTDQLPGKCRDFWGLAWGADGQEIFASIQPGSLWRIPIKDPRTRSRLDLAVSDVRYPAVSPSARRLVSSLNEWVMTSWTVDDPGDSTSKPVPRKLLASTRSDEMCQVSPDGKKIAFTSNRTGPWNIWVCNSDGSGPLMLTSFEDGICGSPGWSPDGRSIVFDARPECQSDIFAVSPEGGPLRQFTGDAAEDAMPSCSRDGRWIYFTSNRTGQWQLWKVPSAGGEPVQVTRKGGFYAQESPDGRTLFFGNDRAAPGVYRMPVEGGEEAMFLSDAWIQLFAPAAKGCYFWRTDGALVFLDSSTGTRRVVTVIDKSPVWFLSVFPDGKRIVYSQLERDFSDLYLVENFR